MKLITTLYVIFSITTHFLLIIAGENTTQIQQYSNCSIVDNTTEVLPKITNFLHDFMKHYEIRFLGLCINSSRLEKGKFTFV